VQDPNPLPFRLHNAASRQRGAERRLVHVALDRDDRRESLQILEDRGGGEVAGMEDEVGPLEDSDAIAREPPPAARQVGVSEECDQRRSGRNSPSR
jgi:hypothetical protein